MIYPSKQLWFKLHLNQRSAHKVMGPLSWDSQSCWSPNFGNFDTKCHLGVGPMARHKVYYKGEGGGFPQVWAVVSLVNSCLLVACLCTKSVQTTH